MPSVDKTFLIQVRADIEKAVADMRRLANTIEKQGKGSKAAAANTQAHGRSLQFLTGAMAAYFSAATLLKGLRLADDFAVLQQRIRTATRETGDYAAVSRELYEISQRNGTALEDTVSTFQRLGIARKELRATNEEILKVTNAVQQLGIQSGASTTAMQAGQMQFAQAMAAGVVRAEEMNSIIENIPAVAERIARGMGMTVGELRNAVLEGKVLSREVFLALLNQAPAINQEMRAIPDSMARSWIKLTNSFGNFLNKLDQATGTTRIIAGLLGKAAQSLDNWSAHFDPTGQYQFNEMVRMRLATMEKIAELEKSGAAGDSEQLATLRENLMVLTAEIERIQELNIQAAKSHEQAGSAGVTAARLTIEEEKRLTQQMELVKGKLSEQIALFEKRKQAVEAAARNLKDFDQYAADSLRQLKSGRADKNALGLGDIMAQMRRARSAINKGDNKQAQEEARRTIELIKEVATSGNEVQGILEYLMKQAAGIGHEAASNLLESQKAEFEKTKQEISDLLGEAQKLKSLKVGFDQEAAKSAGDTLRATLQEEFTNNPLVLPVILQKPATSGSSNKQAADALDQLPGKAEGGLILGPGSGTSDSILMRGSNGEFVVRAAAVRRYGVDFLNRVNREQLPRYADGGLVGRALPSLPAATGAPGATGGRPITLVLDGKRYRMESDNTTADRLVSDFHLSALKGGSRK